jgi:hypothetical protein
VRAIGNCRTRVLGGHIERCTNDVCSYVKNANNSCRNRNCHKCQFSRQIKWVYDRLKELLTVSYYQLVFPGDLRSIEQPADFYDFCSKVRNEKWVVYSKKPFAGSEKVFDYIGRYTHRVAISTHRLAAIDNGSVTFKYKDYQDGEKIKEMTLTADHFVQRFLWHIVPEGFCTIRYYGFLAPGNRQEKVDLIRKLLDVIVEKSSWAAKSISEWLDRYEAILNQRCPMCKVGVIEYLFAPT